VGCRFRGWGFYKNEAGTARHRLHPPLLFQYVGQNHDRTAHVPQIVDARGGPVAHSRSHRIAGLDERFRDVPTDLQI